MTLPPAAKKQPNLGLRAGIALAVIAAVGIPSAIAANNRQDAPAAASTDPPLVCLKLSEGADASLQHHMQDGITIVDTAAIVAPTEEGYWFVVGRFTGAGIEDGENAVWGTHNDPTAEGENAYNSIDAMAASFSDYLTPTFAAGTLPGENEVRTCLG